MNFRIFYYLFCEADCAGFTDNRNLNLSRISHFVLNLLGDFS